MIRALIIDDEMHAREEMGTLLTETGVVTVVGSCSNGFEGLKAINEHKPDVVFLDIEMPAISGFEMLNMVSQDIMPHVVFVTAFEEYSLKAFEEKTLDYLLKPVAMDRLMKTVGKIRELLDREEPTAFKADPIKRVPCLLDRRIKLVGLDEVEYVSAGARGHYIHTANEEFYTDVALKVLEDRTELVRCHKQYLVNMDFVSEIALLDNGIGMITTTAGGTVPVSRRHLKKIKEMILL